MPYPKTWQERFWKFVDVSDPGGCWEWTGGRKGGNSQYGSFCVGKGRTLRAHRASWLLHCGSIPDGICVLHRCDNPLCVRPDHLFLGDQFSNIQDAKEKGRMAPIRIRDEVIEKIREEYIPWKVSLRKLSRKYGVDPGYIYRIIQREVRT